MDEEPVERTESEPIEEAAASGRRQAESLVDLLRAVALGIRDTASDMIAAGREGASEAYDEMWQRFEEKTKRRRERKEDN